MYCELCTCGTLWTSVLWFHKYWVHHFAVKGDHLCDKWIPWKKEKLFLDFCVQPLVLLLDTNSFLKWVRCNFLSKKRNLFSLIEEIFISFERISIARLFFFMKKIFVKCEILSLHEQVPLIYLVHFFIVYFHASMDEKIKN